MEYLHSILMPNICSKIEQLDINLVIDGKCMLYLLKTIL